VVKNITEYGAFVDLGGIDGLLHVTDMAWRRVNHPSRSSTSARPVKVKIIKINHETHRISLGIKQLLADPWEGIAARYPVDAKLKGRVTNITDYGAFVELEPGIEGLIHVSEMSWTKKNVHPGKIVSTSQEVEVVILEVDPVKRRISLGLKQALQNPWEAFAENHPVGSEVEGEVKNKTEFGLFIGLDGDVDGMVHLSDLDWNRPGEQVIDEFKKGDVLRAQVLDVDVEKERISLGLKQLAGDPFADAGEIRKGQVVTCEVLEVKDSGLEVKIVDTDLSTFIRRAELARTAPTSAPNASRRREVDARVVSSTARPAASSSRSRRWRWLRRRRRSRPTARPTPAPRSARSSARPSTRLARRTRSKPEGLHGAPSRRGAPSDTRPAPGDRRGFLHAIGVLARPKSSPSRTGAICGCRIREPERPAEGSERCTGCIALLLLIVARLRDAGLGVNPPPSPPPPPPLMSRASRRPRAGPCIREVPCPPPRPI
jgi:predicted RNA-binding protein with RPS1 domain